MRGCDADFGPIRLRAFGSYALKAEDPKRLLEELVGTDGIFEAEEITTLLRSIINTTFADVIGESKIAALDLASSYTELSEKLRQEVITRVDDEYGLDVTQLMIVNISLPEEVEKALDTRTSMGVTRASYQIQLGALPSEDSARREWARIENRHPDLVVHQTPSIIPVQLSSQPGTVYRLRTGPFGEYKAAQSLCDEFKRPDQDCYVVKTKNPG